MLSNFYEEAGMLLDYVQDATLYNCKLSYCFLEDSYINNSPIGLINPNEARFTNVTLNNLLVTSGNIGIDVANPSYKLDVNGDINFTGFLYKNGILFYYSGLLNSTSGVLYLIVLNLLRVSPDLIQLYLIHSRSITFSGRVI